MCVYKVSLQCLFLPCVCNHSHIIMTGKLSYFESSFSPFFRKNFCSPFFFQHLSFWLESWKLCFNFPPLTWILKVVCLKSERFFVLAWCATVNTVLWTREWKDREMSGERISFKEMIGKRERWRNDHGKAIRKLKSQMGEAARERGRERRKWKEGS